MPVADANRPLAGQSALVTGANSGIGRAIALALARAGAAIAVNYVDNPPAAADVVREIESLGGHALAIHADVSMEADVKQMFSRAIDAFGTLHIAVCNAGVQRDAPVEALSVEQWDQVLAVNLRGQFLCARSAIREFTRRGIVPDVSSAAGKILCISSVHELIPWAGHVNYAASKGGVLMLMKSLAQEVAHLRIRVNAIAPGAIRTPINTAAWETPAALESLLRLIPYGRIGEPEDVAKAAVWLCSDQADYITGTSLFVDGGMTLFPGFATGAG
jgi:glucose 1-dehydrogenase